MLTWDRLNRPKWPGGSLVWRPAWEMQPPLPPSALDSNAMHRPRMEGRPELLTDVLHRRLGLSRGDALALIQRSRVTVDRRLKRGSCWVEPGSVVAVNGRPLDELEGIALVAHKPFGVTLTEGSPLGRPNFRSLLPDPGLVAQPAGRIDSSSSGLLVLTTHRQLAAVVGGAHALLTTFAATLQQPLSSSQFQLLSASHLYTNLGAELVEAELDADRLVLRVSLRGGSAVHVRRALDHAGAEPPKALVCVRLGPLKLEDDVVLAQPGASRSLTEDEERAFLDAA